jgi:hypothetical protein
MAVRLQRRQRLAFKAKEAFIRNELDRAAARFTAGTPSGQERQVNCALDHVSARVMEAATLLPVQGQTNCIEKPKPSPYS